MKPRVVFTLPGKHGSCAKHNAVNAWADIEYRIGGAYLLEFSIMNGFAQERLHTARLHSLIDLFNSGRTQPLRQLLAGLDCELPEGATVSGYFERHKADFTFDVSSGGHRTLVVIEFKVDSCEGGLLESPSADCQTSRLRSAFESEPADQRIFLYVTLGAGEFAGPPKDEQFRWMTLDAFTSIIESVAAIEPLMRPWLGELKAEQDRRSGALELASRAMFAFEGYRSLGVKMAVYARVISSWQRAGFDRQFGTLRAYTPGKADPILNLWGVSGRRWWYFEVNNNGTLNLKVSTGELHDGRWDALRSALQTQTDPDRTSISGGQPPFSKASKTVCSWRIGLWERSTEPDFVVGQMASVLKQNMPVLEQLT